MAAVADEVERLARLAYNDAPATTQDNHAKEQFVDAIMDDDLRVLVLQTRPGTLHDPLRSALELASYTLAVRGTSTVRTIDTSVKQELPELVKQLFTEFSTTMATQMNQMVSHICPEPRTADNRNNQFRGVCWNCSQVGHFLFNVHMPWMVVGSSTRDGEARTEGIQVRTGSRRLNKETTDSRSPGREISCRE